MLTPAPAEVAVEVAQLIASGGAWSDTAAAAVLPAAPDASLTPTDARAAVPPPAGAVGRAGAGVPPQSPGGARHLLEAALADLSLLQDTTPAAAPAQLPAPRRVQLGFRDGTSAVLDPASTQAQALDELAQSLTRRD